MTDANTTDTKDTGKAPKFDGEFDADRAARLVANLRADLDKAKADLQKATETLTAREDAEKSDLQKAMDRIASLEKENAKVSMQSARIKAAAKHNIPDDLAEFLTGETEAEIEAKAESLAKFAGQSKSDEPKTEVTGKPKPRLTPGHESSDSDGDFDPFAIAKAVNETGF
jgi:capsule polysaccharide export protein KpsE/RkpR